MNLISSLLVIVLALNCLVLISGRRFEQGVLFGALLAGAGHGGHGGGHGGGAFQELIPLLLGGRHGRRLHRFQGLAQGHGHRGSNHGYHGQPAHYEQEFERHGGHPGHIRHGFV